MRTKLIAINSFLESIFFVIASFIGLFKVKYIILGIGSTMNGYYQFLFQIITYLFLAEAGLTSGVLFKMYKPIADGDEKKISATFNGAKKIFLNIGKLILLVTLVVTPFLYLYFKKSGVALQLILIFVIMVVTQTLSFLLPSNAYNTLMAADQKRHVFSTIVNIFKIVTDLLTIFVVIKYESLLLLVILTFIFKFIEIIVVIVVGKKMYPKIDSKVKADTSAKKMSKDLIFHQIGDVANSNVDSILLMTILGPVMVSIYSSYNYVSNFIKEFVNKNNNMIGNIFGNAFAKENAEDSYGLYRQYFSIFKLITYLFVVCFALGIRGFINAWIGDSTYILGFSVIIFFALDIMINLIKKPINTMIISSGLYAESKYYSLIETGINLVISLILIGKLGLLGLLIGTCIAGIVGIFIRLNLVFGKVFSRSHLKQQVMKFVKILFSFIPLVFVVYIIESRIIIYLTGLVKWALIIGTYAVVILFVLLVIMYIFDEDFKEVFTRVQGQIKGQVGKMFSKIKLKFAK